MKNTIKDIQEQNESIARAFLSGFASGMGSMGNLWGGLSLEDMPKTSPSTAWADVAKSFRSAGNSIRKAYADIEASS